MSGGSYDYAFHHIDDLAGAIQEKGNCDGAVADTTAAPSFVRRKESRRDAP